MGSSTATTASTPSATLHDPRTRTSRCVAVAWSGGALTIRDGADVRAVAGSIVAAAEGGWSGDHAVLSWTDADGAWALSVARAEMDAFARGAPPRLREALAATWRASEQRRRASLGVFGVAALVIVAVVLAAFALRDRIIGAAVARIPTRVDDRIGSLAERDFATGERTHLDGPAVEAVRAIGGRLLDGAPASPFTFRFYVVRDTTVNAFATPGGVVVVHTGLLARASSAEEAAAVLAHEIAHVLHRDSMHRMVVQLGTSALLQLLLGDVSGVTDRLAWSAAQLGTLRYGRSQEERADLAGIEILRAARLPADGMVRFFEMLARESAEPPAILSTHPASKRRAEAVSRVLERRGTWATEPLALDWSSVQRDATSSGW